MAKMTKTKVSTSAVVADNLSDTDMFDEGRLSAFDAMRADLEAEKAKERDDSKKKLSEKVTKHNV